MSLMVCFKLSNVESNPFSLEDVGDSPEGRRSIALCFIDGCSLFILQPSPEWQSVAQGAVFLLLSFFLLHIAFNIAAVSHVEGETPGGCCSISN